MTKKQHLVWRKYLAPWTNRPDDTAGQIYMYLKGNRTTVRAPLMRVGVENYTYDMSMINEYDREIASAYFNEWLYSNTNLKPAIHIKDSEDFSERDFIEKHVVGVIENQGIYFLNELYERRFPFNEIPIKYRLLQFLEKALIFGLCGYPLLSEQEFSDIASEARKHINDKDPRYEFFEFFAAQLLRTWRGQDSVLCAAKEAKALFPDSPIAKTSPALFPLMMTINTLIFALHFSKENYFIELLINDTDKNFITADNPIINLCVDYTVRASKPPERAEWYYPVTPKIAIICKNNIRGNIKTTLTRKETVTEYNRKISQAATKQVYAASEQDFDGAI